MVLKRGSNSRIFGLLVPGADLLKRPRVGETLGLDIGSNAGLVIRLQIPILPVQFAEDLDDIAITTIFRLGQLVAGTIEAQY